MIGMFQDNSACFPSSAHITCIGSRVALIFHKITQQVSLDAKKLIIRMTMFVPGISFFLICLFNPRLIDWSVGMGMYQMLSIKLSFATEKKNKFILNW